MARITVEDCPDNGFAVVHVAADRCHQLHKGAKPTVEHSKNKGPVVSLREIAAGNVYFEGDLEDILRASLEEDY